ncbi:MAG: acyltransferase family protein [Nocardiopsaceae bacterium]|nr:acyltransferase family protein [Nocardiopsaceae bacterium]
MTSKTHAVADRRSPATVAPRRFFPEVQGLRALAVGLVLVYHVDHELVPGGYVGVDVFFVISGFLITTLLLREAREHGRVSLGGFYVRRIRRILPAATLVLGVTGAAAFFLLPSPRLYDTAMQLIASAAYAENLFLAVQSVDYLAAETAASPVQHFWSLAIEEQFYLVWPLLFLGWAALPPKRRTAKSILAATSAIVIASFACSVWLTANDPQPAYFLPQARMWELAAGGVLAIVLAHRQIPGAARWVLGWSGLATILTVAFVYDDQTAFPGWAAAAPILGTVAVIAAGQSITPWSAYGLLSTRPARFFGDISYALYLWHWPLIVFTLSITGKSSLSWLGGAGVIVLSTLLAWATKLAVEDPIRDGGLLRAGRSAAVFALAAVVLVSTVGVGQYARFQLLRNVEFDPSVHVGPQALATASPEGDTDSPIYPSPVEALEDLPSVYGDDCQATPSVLTPDPCSYGPEDADTTIAIVGDSHAAHWVPALRELAGDRNWRLYTFTKSSCAFTDTLIERDGRPYFECPEWNEAVVEKLVSDVQPDLVFTSSSVQATSYSAKSDTEGEAEIAEGMARLWQPLEEAGSELVVIRDTPRTRARLPECVARHLDELDSCAQTWDDAFASDDPQLRAADRPDNDAEVIDLRDRFCTGGTCPPVIGNVLVYRDSHHLTATYSKLLAPELSKAASSILEGHEKG